MSNELGRCPGCLGTSYRRGNITTTYHQAGCPVEAEKIRADAEDEAERDREAAIDALRDEAWQ